ncbi:MAG TPA: hypothetical protein VEH75_07275, partial [Xanthobacteraceae bacterium]|nr:hypothetical protein [Xanthobacteraceae bacterium]
YVDVGRGNPILIPAPCVCTVEVDKHRYGVMKFGVNYLFGAKPQPALAPGNWGGFYAGVVGGSGVSQSRATGAGGGVVGSVGIDDNGFTLGGLAGFNWQIAPRWVAGFEGDFSWFGINDSHQAYNNGSIFGLETSWFATARGRLGYSTGPALLYLTGGGAWVNLEDKFNLFLAPTSGTQTLGGYTVGGGIETVLSGNWTTRTEYLFVDVGNGPALTSGGLTTTANHKFHFFRGALTYRFGG